MKTFSELDLLTRFYYETVHQPVLVDVGAGDGSFSKPFAVGGWRVVAIEGDAKRADTTKQTLNGYKDTHLIAPSKGVNPASGEMHNDGSSKSEPFPVHLDETLQTIGLEHVSLLKINSRGAGLPILKTFNFNRFSPEVVMCEYLGKGSRAQFGYSLHDIARFMMSREYHAFITEWECVNNLAPGGLRFRQLTAYPSGNTPETGNFIFVRKDKLKNFRNAIQAYGDFLNQSANDQIPEDNKASGAQPIYLPGDIRAFKNRFKGNRAFILGNGPSLARTPLSLLKNEYTFAMNRISLIFDQTDWRPDFFSCTTLNIADPDWRRDIQTTINTGIPCFIWDKLAAYVNAGPNLYFINCTHGEQVVANAPADWWSDDISNSVCKFGTSLLPAVQITAYMGFDPIYLLGCDLGFQNEVDQNGNVIPDARGGNDPNHFHPGYSTPGISASKAFDVNALNRNMMAAHHLIKTVCDKNNIRIYNATLGGSLEVYPRVAIDDILAKPADSGQRPRQDTADAEPGKHTDIQSGSCITLLDPDSTNSGDSRISAESILQCARNPAYRPSAYHRLMLPWIAGICESFLKPGQQGLEIRGGSNGGALHHFLEKRFDVTITGMDRHKRGKSAYVDIAGNFYDDQQRRQHGFAEAPFDFIYSVDPFEHHTLEGHRRLYETAMECLKPGGHLVVTYYMSLPPENRISGNEWNIRQEDLSAIYGIDFQTFPFGALNRRYQAIGTGGTPGILAGGVHVIAGAQMN
ncbi:MAG: 6-hydroxymethylpterin diphosphokinase MptE-like protein [Thermodesulfobacteriota bacterium]|nr:6-hydroxymethylpterin diphosphokinase MptE-like protein [Thermodesulfobacteriota bacterium]